MADEGEDKITILVTGFGVPISGHNPLNVAQADKIQGIPRHQDQSFVGNRPQLTLYYQSQRDEYPNYHTA